MVPFRLSFEFLSGSSQKKPNNFLCFSPYSSTDKSSSANTPLKAIQCNKNELDSLSKRQSATKRKIRSGSPMPEHYTPIKTPSKKYQHGTPGQENKLLGTPKSILKPFSIRLNRGKFCRHFLCGMFFSAYDFPMLSILIWEGRLSVPIKSNQHSDDEFILKKILKRKSPTSLNLIFLPFR